MSIRKLRTGPAAAVDTINSIIDAVNGSSKLVSDGYIKITQTQSGIFLSLDINKLHERLPHNIGGIGFGLVRRAVLTESAGADNTITAHLYDASGVEITTGDGHDITVYCSIMGATTPFPLNAAVPRLVSGEGIMVVQFPVWIEAVGEVAAHTELRWGCVSVFQKSRDCA